MKAELDDQAAWMRALLHALREEVRSNMNRHEITFDGAHPLSG